MRELRLAGLAIAICAALAPGAAASPSSPAVPPDLSAAAQYTETLPGAGGERPTRGDDGDGRTATEVLGPRRAARLEGQGADGLAAARLAARTAAPGTLPATVGGGATGNGRAEGGEGGAVAAGTARRGAADPSGASPLAQVLSQLGGAGDSADGMGALLPLSMLAAMAAAGGYLLRQRRGSAS